MNKLVDACMDSLPAYDRDEMFKPLNPDLEYVDASEYELEMARLVQALDTELKALKEQVAMLGVNSLTMAKVVRELREQSTSLPQSAIIIPDRFN